MKDLIRFGKALFGHHDDSDFDDDMDDSMDDDFDDVDDSMDDDDDIYNDTSSDHSNPSFGRKSCWEYPECKKRHLAENGTYHVVTGL
ncbi:MAG: hypothetical protein IJ635_03235 [Bacteroidaceae bacterium]|nr:hypothetical protein [Bacteroidaceae bacterium]